MAHRITEKRGPPQCLVVAQAFNTAVSMLVWFQWLQQKTHILPTHNAQQRQAPDSAHDGDRDKPRPYPSRFLAPYPQDGAEGQGGAPGEEPEDAGADEQHDLSQTFDI